MAKIEEQITKFKLQEPGQIPNRKSQEPNKRTQNSNHKNQKISKFNTQITRFANAAFWRLGFGF
ncbi:hypothetical protein FAM09_30280 [Niastella caeni]|uniref:Uncharacterized protein n=1 Tax=Niastella caeni TaxID=2569763 RepID=A0A4S8H799_9BACT|nr:hypothetical protein [Niastella caeni]THU30447.1 hypothetical protein FAM09_30280 [Niastella caeni]